MSTPILYLHRTLIIAFVLGFTAVNYLLNIQPIVERWFINMGWTLAAGFSALACFLAARHLKRPYRTAWTYYALGCTSWFIGMLIWDFNELVLNWRVPFPSPADIGFLLLGPLFTIGLIYNFTKNPAVTLTLRNLADLGVIICSVLIFSLFVFSESLIKHDSSLLYKITALSFPALDMSAFAFAILLLLRHGHMRQHYAVIFIIISLGLHAVANLFYAHSLLNHSYDIGHYLDIVWIIAFAVSYLAAIEVIKNKNHRYAAGPMFVSDKSTQIIETGMFTAGLLLLAVAGYNYHDFLDHEIWNIILGTAILMAILLGLREWANYQLARKLNEDIHRSEKELSTILGSLQDTYFRTNKDYSIKMISDSIETLLGYGPLELMDEPLASLFADSEELQRCLNTLASNTSGLQNHEIMMKHKHGSNVWVSLNMQYIRGETSEVTGTDGTIRDVSLRRQADAEMYKLSSALEKTADSVLITSRVGIIEYINPAFEKTTGYTKTEAVGRSPNIVKSGKQSEAFYQRLWSTILGGEVFSEIFINKRKNGDLYYEAKTITPLKNENGEITHFVSTGKDITEQMQTQEQLKFMAQHDILTELPNRALLLDRINQSLARARWHDRLVAILFLDLDRFKNINDSLGHNVGDQILIQLAERLHRQVRDRDTIARFGGDEFTILLDDIANENDVSNIAQKVLDSLKDVFVIDGMELHVSASIGISIYPTDGEDSQTLLKNADSAMYRAKEAGKDTYKFYSSDMSIRAFERLTLENHLRYALQRNEFVLYYQPQVYIQTGRIVGFEALLRWQNPELGLIAPGDFISLLEETGMIVNVGEWVLIQACRQLKQWNTAGFTTLKMAVNISPRQFNDSSFKTSIKHALSQSDIRPEHLQLEMTESTFMRETNTTDYTFAALSELGVSLAIDDFGTGYSALSYLKRFEIDTLKIDRTFVRDITTDENDAALTSAIIAMAKSLGMQVIAEGVETEEQLAFLKQQGCDHVQGFLLGKPQPASAISELLAKNSPTQ